jgi:hypothetical protein
MCVQSTGAEESTGSLSVDEISDRNGLTLKASGEGARHTLFAASPEPADSFGAERLRRFFDDMEIFGEPSTWHSGTLTAR